jgi:hypothetical protein
MASLSSVLVTSINQDTVAKLIGFMDELVDLKERVSNITSGLPFQNLILCVVRSRVIILVS